MSYISIQAIYTAAESGLVNQIGRKGADAGDPRPLRVWRDVAPKLEFVSCYRCARVWQRLIVIFLLTLFGVPELGVTAERSRPIRIGVLTSVWGPPPQVAALRDGLQSLGYRENEDFVIGVRFTQGDLNALPAAARQLVGLGVDIIFAHRGDAAKAVQRTTSKIPVVFVAVSDPVGLGLLQSYARPGGNITGVTSLELTLGPKRLELFREIVPKLRKVLFPYDPMDAYSARGAKVYRKAAERIGIELLEKPVRTEEEALRSLSEVRKEEVDGILKPLSMSINIPGLILDTAAKQRIPTMFNAAFWVERGALASYGPDGYAAGRQAARLVHKILKGMAPAEIPVEVSDNVEFSINARVAESLGLTLPPEVLYQANRLFR